MRRLPCGISNRCPVAESKTFWLTWARIGPGRSESIPLTNTAGITLPAITMYGEAGGCSVTLDCRPRLHLRQGYRPALRVRSELQRAATVKGADHLRCFERPHIFVFGPLRVAARRPECAGQRRLRSRYRDNRDCSRRRQCHRCWRRRSIRCHLRDLGLVPFHVSVLLSVSGAATVLATFSPAERMPCIPTTPTVIRTPSTT